MIWTLYVIQRLNCFRTRKLGYDFEIFFWNQLKISIRRLIHREKRQFLRSALRELSILWSTWSPWTQALYVLIGLSMARDELHWLLRHQYLHWYDPNKPAKLTKNMQKEDRMDKQFIELLFLVEELRSLCTIVNSLMCERFKT